MSSYLRFAAAVTFLIATVPFGAVALAGPRTPDTTASDNSGYLFDPEVLNELGLQAGQEVDAYLSALPDEVVKQLAISYFNSSSESNPDLIPAFRKETMLDRTQELISQKYPGKILQDTEWVFNNVGGIYGRLRLLYCSFSEYVALFGTDLPQQGFSGEYGYMDVYDIMLSGKMQSEEASSTGALPVTYVPEHGKSYSILLKKTSRYYNMAPYTYMIDYGRGHITPALWQGVIAPYLFSSHDYQSTKTQLKDCGLSIYRVLSHR